MKFIEDLFKSFSGSAKAKVSDPFLGAFIGSWIICNWSQLAILLWGEDKVSLRIIAFQNYLRDSNILELNSIFFVPLCFAVGYVFAYPWISYFFKKAQEPANNKLHNQDVSIQLNNILRQEALNRQNLLADPSKKFLERSTEIYLERKKTLGDRSEARTKKRIAMAEDAAANARATAADAESKRIQRDSLNREEEKKADAFELEKKRMQLESTRIASAQASVRFPSAYGIMSALETSLSKDDVKLSLSGLSEIAAKVFGYKNFEELLLDQNFNNISLQKVKYIYYDALILTSDLSAIVINENNPDPNLDHFMLFDHVHGVFDDLGMNLVDEEAIKELAYSFIEEEKYGLIHGDDLSGVMAESNTSYDEVYIEGVESIDMNESATVTFNGQMSGTHYREYDVRGVDLIFSVEVKNKYIVGSRGLGDFELGAANGDLEY